jgi:hypothetical protein
LKLTHLWQFTDGKNFIQLIYNNKSLVDCEYIDDNGNNFVTDFVDKFTQEYHYIRKDKLSSTKHARHHQYHESMNIIDNEVLTIKPNVKFIQLKKIQEIPEHLLNIMNLKKLKRQCNQLHKRIRQNLRAQHIDYTEHKTGDVQEQKMLQEEEEEDEEFLNTQIESNNNLQR